MAVFGGFEIDGNLEPEKTTGTSGLNYDWSNLNLASPTSSLPFLDGVKNDPFNTSADTQFVPGSKISDLQRSVTNGPSPSKSDLTRMYVGHNATAAGVFLYMAFNRYANNGDAFTGFELNQSAETYPAGAGVSLPKRTDGDLLIDFDFKNSAVQIGIMQWDAAKASWVEPITRAIGVPKDLTNNNYAQGTINTVPVTNPPSLNPPGSIGYPSMFPTATFGEAAVNLSASLRPGDPPRIFKSVYLATRSSSEYNSTLKDIIAPVAVDIPTKGEISGFKFNDLNGDGIWQKDTETPIAGQTIELLDSSGKSLTTAVTDAAGNYSFAVDASLTSATTYKVREQLYNSGLDNTLVQKELVPPIGSGVTAEPITIDADKYGSSLYVVPVKAGNPVVGVNFGNRLEGNLSIEKSDGQDKTSAVPGETVTYTIVVSNSGPSTAKGATVKDIVPLILKDVIYTSVSVGGASGNTANGTGSISDTVTLPSGGKITYTLTGRIDASATGSLENTATVTAPSGFIDTKPSDNIATDTDTLSGSVDLSIVKSDTPDPVTAGTDLTYTLTVSTAGPSDAKKVVVSDVLPAGTSYVSSSDGGQYDSEQRTVTWNLGDVPANALAKVLTLVVHVDSSLTTDLSNTAKVSSDTTDSNEKNNSSTATTTVITSADLSIVKSDGEDTVTAGDGKTHTYTITVTNVGPSDARGVTVLDTWPVAFTQGTWTPSVGTVPPGENTWNVGALASGSSATLKVTYTVGASVAAGTYTNTATVSSPTDPSDSTATDETTVVRLDVSLVKPGAINENGSVLLTGTVSDPENSTRTVTIVWGDGTANTVVTLPAGATTLQVPHQYLDDGPKGSATFDYPVSVTATLSASAAKAETITAVTVNNVAPKVSKIGNMSIDEGTTISRAVSFTDPGTLDHWTYTVIWGDGSAEGPISTTSRSFVITHTYADNGDYSPKVVVNDDDTGEGVSSFKVTVNNVDPMLDLPSSQVVSTTVPLTINPSFSDPGFNTESFTYSIDWGDGKVDSGSATPVVNGGPGVPTTGSFSGTHSYTTPGVYTVTLTVKDDDGGEDSVPFDVTAYTPQMVLGGPAASGIGVGALQTSQLQPLISAALEAWRAAGLKPAQLTRLRRTPIQIADLPGGMVGGSNANGIVIDATAAGHGWFVDGTPRDSVEFLGGAHGQARGRVDLLTVIAHEMGNVLGLPETTGNGIMGRDLAVGTRRIPVRADLRAQADAPTSTQPALAPGSIGRLNRLGFVAVPDDLATDVAGAAAPWTRSTTARRKGR